MVEVFVQSDLVNGLQRLRLEWTLDELAKKLEHITGIPPQSQQIEITQVNKTVTFKPFGSHELVESLNLEAQSVVKVEDTRSPEEQLNLDDAPELPAMSDTDYEKRTGTVLAYKREHKLGRFAEKKGEKPTASAGSGVVPTVEDLQVGLDDDCFVKLSSGQTARGTVAFIGEVAPIDSGIWVGVRLTSALGRNNGTVKGIKLFDAAPHHGVLVRPNVVRPLDDDELEL